MQNSITRTVDEPDKMPGKEKRPKKKRALPEEDAPGPLEKKDDEADDDDDEEDEGDDGEEESRESREPSSDDDLWNGPFSKSLPKTVPQAQDSELGDNARFKDVPKALLESFDPSVLKTIPAQVASPNPKSLSSCCRGREDHSSVNNMFIHELRSDLLLWLELLSREQMVAIAVVVDCCSLEGRVVFSCVGIHMYYYAKSDYVQVSS